MLPEKYFIDDQKWILSQIKSLPVHLWDKAAENYSKVFSMAYANEKSNDLLKLQAARTEANTRLRKYVEAVTKSTA